MDHLNVSGSGSAFWKHVALVCKYSILLSTKHMCFLFSSDFYEVTSYLIIYCIVSGRWINLQ